MILPAHRERTNSDAHEDQGHRGSPAAPPHTPLPPRRLHHKRLLNQLNDGERHGQKFGQLPPCRRSAAIAYWVRSLVPRRQNLPVPVPGTTRAVEGTDLMMPFTVLIPAASGGEPLACLVATIGAITRSRPVCSAALASASSWASMRSVPGTDQTRTRAGFLSP